MCVWLEILKISKNDNKKNLPDAEVHKKRKKRVSVDCWSTKPSVSWNVLQMVEARSEPTLIGPVDPDLTTASRRNPFSLLLREVISI
jgi:hypothetical protein